MNNVRCRANEPELCIVGVTAKAPSTDSSQRSPGHLSWWRDAFSKEGPGIWDVNKIHKFNMNSGSSCRKRAFKHKHESLANSCRNWGRKTGRSHTLRVPLNTREPSTASSLPHGSQSPINSVPIPNRTNTFTSSLTEQYVCESQVRDLTSPQLESHIHSGSSKFWLLYDIDNCPQHVIPRESQILLFDLTVTSKPKVGKEYVPCWIHLSPSLLKRWPAKQWCLVSWIM